MTPTPASKEVIEESKVLFHRLRGFNAVTEEDLLDLAVIASSLTAFAERAREEAFKRFYAEPNRACSMVKEAALLEAAGVAETSGPAFIEWFWKNIHKEHLDPYPKFIAERIRALAGKKEEGK